MKTTIEPTLWSIIERLQRRLERQGLSPKASDRVVGLALRQILMAR